MSKKLTKFRVSQILRAWRTEQSFDNKICIWFIYFREQFNNTNKSIQVLSLNSPAATKHIRCTNTNCLYDSGILGDCPLVISAPPQRLAHSAVGNVCTNLFRFSISLQHCLYFFKASLRLDSVCLGPASPSFHCECRVDVGASFAHNSYIFICLLASGLVLNL